MKITRLQTENVQRIEAVDITPGDEPLVQITGANEAGKSSVLDSIMMAMGGQWASSLKPLHDGATKGLITLQLDTSELPGITKYKITKSITPKGQYLRIENADGSVCKSPQALIDSWKNDFTFDPLAFAEAPSADQRRMLLAAIDLQADPAEIERIADVKVRVSDFADDPLAVIEQTCKYVRNARQDIGREKTRAKQAAEIVEITPEMAKAKRIDAADIIAQKAKDQEQEKVNQEKRDDLTLLVDNFIAINADVDDKKSEIACLQKEVEQLTAKAHESKRACDAQHVIVSALVDPDVAKLDAMIETAQEANRAVDQREQKKQLEEAAQDIGTEYDRLTTVLDSLAGYRESLLKVAELPIEGLSLDSEGVVTFEGIPVSQRGTSQRIKLGLALCAAMQPDIRVVLVQSGNDIDDDGMETIYQWARGNDMQVWIEKIKPFDKGVAFEIVDGSLSHNTIEETK